MSRWLAVLSAVTTFGTLNGAKRPHTAAVGKKISPGSRWEREWAADRARLLRILRAL
jgi:hypothetical protein